MKCNKISRKLLNFTKLQLEKNRIQGSGVFNEGLDLKQTSNISTFYDLVIFEWAFDWFIKKNLISLIHGMMIKHKPMKMKTQSKREKVKKNRFKFQRIETKLDENLIRQKLNGRNYWSINLPKLSLKLLKFLTQMSQFNIQILICLIFIQKIHEW